MRCNSLKFKNQNALGVCQTDQPKGIFRRRPSSGSTRSISRSNSLKPPSTGAQSCPSSPKHLQRRPIRNDSISKSSTFQIPEDDVLDVNYDTSGPSSLPEPTFRERERYQEELKQCQQDQNEQKQMQFQQKQQQQSPQLQQKYQSQQSQQEKLQEQIQTQQSKQQQSEQKEQRDKQKQKEQQQDQNNYGLHRSASTISSSAFRPRSSPSGLHSYTGRTSASSTPSSVHGSRVDITKDERGSAIYLGCNAPKANSSWSISSAGSCSQPATPNQTPPVSPRKPSSVKRTSSIVKRNR